MTEIQNNHSIDNPKFLAVIFTLVCSLLTLFLSFFGYLHIILSLDQFALRHEIPNMIHIFLYILLY